MPLSFLFEENVRFTGDNLSVNITGVEVEAGVIVVSFQDPLQPQSGTVSLYFEENPLIFRQWKVVDPSGRTVVVLMSDVKKGITLESNLFKVPDDM